MYHPNQTVVALVADVNEMDCDVIASQIQQSNYPIKVAAIAVDSFGVQSAVKRLEPDVAVISARLKDGPRTGLKVARKLWTSGSNTKAIIRTNTSENHMVTEVFRSGAYGIISKEDSFDRLCKCIYVVYQGQVWISSSQMVRLIDYLVQTVPYPRLMATGFDLLTAREKKIADLIGAGLTNRAISRRLNLNQQTVRNYLVGIFHKLGTSTRLELAVYINGRNRWASHN
ncbi:MAG: response regulator transcription factor [Candidatus Acidiferrales bacterium]